MRGKGKKTLAAEAEFGPQRREFVETNSCMVCGGAACDCHEIARGPARSQAYKNPRLWMSLCRTDHEDMGCLRTWPLAKQVACKIVYEMRKTVWDLNEARGRAQTDVTVEDVLKYVLLMTEDEA